MTKEDLANYRAMRAIINNGKFDVKGDAILRMASLFHWFNQLEQKIEEAAAEPVLQGVVIESLEEDKEE